MHNLDINGKATSVTVSEDMPLLWVLRDELHLTGTKFGCGMGVCGACTIHLDGEPTRACITPISAALGKKITTIEGIAASKAGQAVQTAWRELDVVQCGYCQSGQIMAATALVAQRKHITDEDINQSMAGNVCRCATYVRIRAAIHQAKNSLEIGESQ